MRVIGFVSSPRQGGNSELAVKEMMRCLPDDWEKVMLRLNELDIADCRACYRCVPEGAKCVIKDDLDKIIRNIKHSDKVIIAFPAYVFSAPGPVKTIMDRLISLTSDHPNFPKSDCVMVLPYGMKEMEGMFREDALVLANKLHLNVLAAETMLATLPGDSVQGENLEMLHRLADLLVSGDASDAPAQEMLTCPHCSSGVLKVYPNGRIRCGVCGGTSTLVQGETLSLTTDDSDLPSYFTPARMDEHTQYLDDKKNLFIKNVKHIKELQASYADMDLWWHDPKEK